MWIFPNDVQGRTTRRRIVVAHSREFHSSVQGEDRAPREERYDQAVNEISIWEDHFQTKNRSDSQSYQHRVHGGFAVRIG